MLKLLSARRRAKRSMVCCDVSLDARNYLEYTRENTNGSRSLRKIQHNAICQEQPGTAVHNMPRVGRGLRQSIVIPKEQKRPVAPLARICLDYRRFEN